MAYTIYNYKGEELETGVSEDSIKLLIESVEFNVFQWGENIVEHFKQQLESGAVTDLDGTRIYKKIEE